MEIFISAGEASGDLHGSHLARAIWSIAPQTRLSCLGGPHMQAAGVQAIVDNRSISVVGATEVVGPYPGNIWRLDERSGLTFLQRRPSSGRIDRFSRFQSVSWKVCQKNRRQGLLLHQPPALGLAGRPHKKIRKLVDRMAVILPFEKSFYASHGIDVDYVGHPLVDIMADLPDKTQCDRLYHNFNGPLVGLLPGSRRSEIKLLFDILMDAGRIISHDCIQTRLSLLIAVIGENYFGEDNCECLCVTCEEKCENGWSAGADGETRTVPKKSIEEEASGSTFSGNGDD